MSSLATLSDALAGAPMLALPAAITWGLASIWLSPCHLAGVPLIVGWLALAPCHQCIFQRLLYVVIAPLALNPLIKAWAEQLPDDATFRRVPVTFGRAAWANLARLSYALELDGSLAERDQAVFDAVTNTHATSCNARTPRLSRSTAPPCRKGWSSQRYSAMKKRPLPELLADGSVRSSGQAMV